MKNLILPFLIVVLPLALKAQHHHESTQKKSNATAMAVISRVESQPLLSQAVRLSDALTFLGSSLSSQDAALIKELRNRKADSTISRSIQHILDPYCLAMVTINPESRVSVIRGPAQAKMVQGGWTSFLVKVHNMSGSNAKLEVQSINSLQLFHRSTSDPQPRPVNKMTPGEVDNRFVEMDLYRNRPLESNLSGLLLEYVVLQIYSKEKGERDVEIGFHVGQGTQDIGFRNAINVLFNIQPSVKVKFEIKDDNGAPVMASFVITDGIERLHKDTVKDFSTVDYRILTAQNEFARLPKRLTGLYPLPSRRLAATDEYPDFYFQPQVYRFNGEHVSLSPGKYNITYTRGPEYLPQTKQVTVPTGVDSVKESFQLKRWINMAKLGWYSGDHHVHAAGCSHYESPADGVEPIDMFRQSQGEDLNMAEVLTWGPGWYHQKSYFTGDFSPLSTKENIMRYDIEVSGFPSSHAGHICLLDLKEDDYPGTTKIEEWPTWTLPVLKWAQGQGGITGYAHSGWGLEPVTPTNDLPNYVLPKMNSIGANEYIVTVTQDAVDMYSAGDTPAPSELNMWYHTLNSGYRVRLSGETDFPCIYDERIGFARSYFKTDKPVVAYSDYISAIKSGRSYISDGSSHIIDFTVNGVEMGTKNSEVNLSKAGAISVKGKVAAYLPAEQDAAGELVANLSKYQMPYWAIERARIKKSRKIPVELLVNGVPVDTMEMEANGSWKDVTFNYQMKRSGWVALRIYPSAHTNPVFVIVNKKPIRVKKSIEWCRQSVDQCWTMKKPKIRESEQSAAEAAYDRARKIYDQLLSEAAE